MTPKARHTYRYVRSNKDDWYYTRLYGFFALAYLLMAYYVASFTSYVITFLFLFIAVRIITSKTQTAMMTPQGIILRRGILLHQTVLVPREQIDFYQAQTDTFNRRYAYCVSVMLKSGRHFPILGLSSRDDAEKKAKELAEFSQSGFRTSLADGLSPKQCSWPHPSDFNLRFGTAIVLMMISTLLVGFLFMRGLQRANAEAYEEIRGKLEDVYLQAENIQDSFEPLNFSERFIRDKVIIVYPPNSEQVRLILPWWDIHSWKANSDFSKLKNLNTNEIKTVVIIENSKDDWGEASGKVVLLQDQKYFSFSVSSSMTKKKLGRRISGIPYVMEMLENLPRK